jgi:hypothetical protein
MAIIICILMAFIIWEERRASSEYKGVFDPKAISKLDCCGICNKHMFICG